MNERKAFPEIASQAWEHPADTAALAAVQAVPGLDKVLKAILSFTSDRALRLVFLGSAVRVTDLQFPRVHRLKKEVCRILDYDESIDVFVSYSPTMIAGALGVNAPFVTLSSSFVSALDDVELMSVIGHEIGHCLSGHVLYKTLLWIFVNIGFEFSKSTGTDLLMLPVVAALREWDRKSELSADRAGLLACQNEDAAYRVLMKMAGGNSIGEMNFGEFLKQAAEFERGGDIVDSVHKLLNTWSMSHPWPIVRIPELKRWIDDGSYRTVLSGEYVRRAAAKDTTDAFRAAREQYRAEFQESSDPGKKLVGDLAKAIDDLGSESRKIIENLFDQLRRK